MITRDDVQASFQRFVAIKLEGSDVEIRGTILEVSDNSFALQMKSDTQIIDIRNVDSLIERRRGVTIRRIREFGDNLSVRQHLADRHAIFVTLLKACDEDLCHRMHSKINHDDLGHRHEKSGDADERLAMIDKLKDKKD